MNITDLLLFTKIVYLLSVMLNITDLLIVLIYLASFVGKQWHSTLHGAVLCNKGAHLNMFSISLFPFPYFLFRKYARKLYKSNSTCKYFQFCYFIS